jgi:hypothetical protein
MRAAPPCAVTVARFGAWRGGVALLSALSAAVSVAWVVLRLELAAPWLPSLMAAAAAAALSAASTRRASVALRWDGQTWFVGESACVLDVMIDAGPWLLLRLSGDARVLWLPVQRGGLEASWHALRAAVYSPRPIVDAANAGLE